MHSVKQFYATVAAAIISMAAAQAPVTYVPEQQQTSVAPTTTAVPPKMSQVLSVMLDRAESIENARTVTTWWEYGTSTETRPATTYTESAEARLTDIVVDGKTIQSTYTLPEEVHTAAATTLEIIHPTMFFEGPKEEYENGSPDLTRRTSSWERSTRTETRPATTYTLPEEERVKNFMTADAQGIMHKAKSTYTLPEEVHTAAATTLEIISPRMLPKLARREDHSESWAYGNRTETRPATTYTEPEEERVTNFWSADAQGIMHKATSTYTLPEEVHTRAATTLEIIDPTKVWYFDPEETYLSTVTHTTLVTKTRGPERASGAALPPM